MIKRKNQKGQALVLVLLSLAVVLTLVLYILSRSITDIATSTSEDEAVRAFSAAEAGVERALVVGSFGGALGDANFNAEVGDYAKGLQYYDYPIRLNSGDTATLWFVAHDDDYNLYCGLDEPCFTGSTVKVCWGKLGTASNTATTPALEMTFAYTTTPFDFSTVQIARAVVDPNTTRDNNFPSEDQQNCGIDGTNVAYQFQKIFDLSSLGIPAGSYGSQGGLLFAKARMLYNSDQAHEVGFDLNFGGNSLIPSQGQLIDSTGTSGESNRRLEVFQAWPEPPAIFDSVVFSSGSLTK